MKSFNTQFATQRLRSLNEEVKFNIEDSDLYTAIMDTYMSDTPMPIRDEGDYLVTDDATYQNLQNMFDHCQDLNLNHLLQMLI